MTDRIPSTPETKKRLKDYVDGLGSGATYDDAINFALDYIQHGTEADSDYSAGRVQGVEFRNKKQHADD